ncbi:hypothetical protein [Puerhibacterium puerhi]|uniref:hypothetical protein n=1 Tax=Puerhibacterium puerhi TaxID=2692623 RepID=UPI001F30CC03|nr:hypothetical protein [Puerhibacterium puerhi]
MWRTALGSTTVAALTAAAARAPLWPRHRRRGPHRPRRAQRRRRRIPGPDPLTTLRLQVRLGELARQLRDVEQDPAVYARAHHWHATQGAYDALLREACRMAGVPVDDRPLRADERTAAAERLRIELELAARGWSW